MTADWFLGIARKMTRLGMPAPSVLSGLDEYLFEVWCHYGARVEETRGESPANSDVLRGLCRQRAECGMKIGSLAR